MDRQTVVVCNAVGWHERRLQAAQFSALLEMRFEPARSHYGLGWAAEARGDRAAAAVEYRRALGLDPSLSAARDGLARVGKLP